MLGHEISHVANGDMVTLTLIQGVLNTFVIFLVARRRLFRRPRAAEFAHYNPFQTKRVGNISV